MTMKFRLEQDSFGELLVPFDALYGAQTQRAVQNFALSGLRMPPEFIQSMALIKAAAAEGVAAGPVDPGHRFVHPGRRTGGPR
mgnify:CR=1 FL=1